MKKRYSISTKFFWVLMAVNIVSITVYTFISYNVQHKAYLDGVDKKLFAAARALPYMLPVDAIHDKITGPDSISPQEHAAYLSFLSEYTKEIKIVYLYTYMRFDNTFRTITTNATRRELKALKAFRGAKREVIYKDRNKLEKTLADFFTENKKNPDAFFLNKPMPFFKKYENPPQAMLIAWETKTIQYAEYTDDWRSFRSIFIPMQTKSGTPYLIGADVWIRDLARELSKLLIFYCEIAAVIIVVTLFFGGGLKKYIDKLQTTIDTKERIDRELAIAHNIQMSLVKHQFPPFPERSEFDLYATLVPAREVGGDLYDFFLLDEDHLFFYIGDVSDKGVPAALFMAVTMTLMSETAQAEYLSTADPAEILKKVNVKLLAGNENLLFVTLVCFILNIKTGILTYSNAGHNPPVILRNDGRTEWLPLPHGLILGVMPDAVFSTESFQLHPGDKIILETDGVTEAMNAEEVLYSSERFIETIRAQQGKTPEEITTAIMSSVREHANGVPASDDITIMTLEYNG